MTNKLVARGRMGSYELTEGRKEHFYVPTPLGTELSSKAVSDNLDGIQATLLNMNDSTEKRLAELEAIIGRLEPFPVGSVFISIDNENPATKIGYGNWVLTSGGRCLVGAGDGKNLGETGGQRTVALNESHMPNHKHDVYVGDLHATVATDVQGGVRGTDVQGHHSHRVYNATGGSLPVGVNVVDVASAGTLSGSFNKWETMEASGNHSHNIDINHAHNVNISHGHGVGETTKGGNAAFNIENPYFVVNIWYRVS